MNPSTKHTILLVDDEESILRSLTILLQPYYNVICANNGANALKIINQENLSCIVSDYDMENGDGLFILKNMPKSSIVPFVLITGRGEKTLFKEFANNKVFFIYEKPIKVNIVEIIEQAISHYLTQKNLNRNSLLGRTTGQIIHDLNNNLGVIQLSSEIGKEKTADSFTKKLFERTLESTSKITTMIAKYKTFFNGNTQNIDYAEVSATNFIEKLTAELKNTALNKRASLTFENNSVNNPLIQIDSDLITQVLLNLINNSLYEISAQSHPWIKVSLSNSDKKVFIKVMDSGNGVESSILPNLFKEGYTSKGNNGTGMGLSYCKQIMNLHLGDVKYSLENNNTCFTLELPKL